MGNRNDIGNRVEESRGLGAQGGGWSVGVIVIGIGVGGGELLTVGCQQRGAAAVDEDVVDYNEEGEGGEFADEELLVLKVGEVLG